MDETRRQQVAALLLEHWDPIGVRDLDVEPESEYLHEAGQAWELLSRGVSEGQLVTWLLATEQRIGRPAPSRAPEAARALLAWHTRSA